jgi:Na+/proline symporter
MNNGIGLHLIDWIVLLGTIALIVGYGIWKTSGKSSMNSFLLGDSQSKWWVVGLSIMATQASAITFLSVPGQAYADGIGFIQFYFGLPLAMIVLSITAVPLYSKLKVFTAYEYLENRFDVKTRTLASMLFLLQRGLSTGVTIYAPSIVLCAVIGWPLQATILFIGTLVIIYTVIGGNKAVNVTHKQQMFIILLGMGIAGYIIVKLLPEGMGVVQATQLAKHLGKLEAIDLKFDLASRYNIWSGLIGGFFLQLSYFGTDQSQVARYLGGESVTQSRLGLMMNGLIKIPMQLAILFVGVLVFVFYQFQTPPLYFNQVEEQKVLESPLKTEWLKLDSSYQVLEKAKQVNIKALQQALATESSQLSQIKSLITQQEEEEKEIRATAKSLIKQANAKSEGKDTDYVFIRFILAYLPQGLVGLLLAVMFSAAMSSTSAALISLSGTTVVDLYKRGINPEANDKQLVVASKWFVVLWGVIAIGFALIAGMVDNLIQAVNILGSLFYGVILGIFVAGFYVKQIKGWAVFIAALLSEAVVLYCFNYVEWIGFLWYNVIGCLLVIAFGLIIQFLMPIRFTSK